MAFTTPRTWVAGEKPTAATLNVHIRDNLLALGSAWTTYTPVLTGPTIGNGTITGRYLLAGKTVHFIMEAVFGSTSTYGTGSWSTNFPVPEVANRWIFQAVGRSSSTYPITAERVIAGSMLLVTPATTAGGALRFVNSTAPFTWAATHTLTIAGTYEAS